MAVLLTPRLRLRPRTLADLEPIVEMDADPRVRRYIGGPLDRVSHRAEVRRRIVEGRPEPHASWAIEWRDRPGFLGLCALSPSQEPGFTEIGWRLAHWHWGQGIASEAAAAVADRALGVLGIAPLLALINPENAASIRVAEKLGFRCTGEAQFRGVRQLLYQLDRAGDAT